MWAKILLIIFVFSFLFRTDHSFDQDLGRHIKLGEIIIQTGQVPKINLFSYTNENFTFINTHWLFEVMAYFFSQTVGLQLFLIIKIIIIIISVWLTIKIIPKQDSSLLLPIGFIFLHVLRERIELRPEIFSFLFTATTYYILERYLRGPTRLIFLLPLIQLIWINAHIYFFIGLLLQTIFLIHLTHQYLRSHLESGRLKILGIVFILSVLLSLINPNGLNGLLYPLNVTENYGYNVVENQTMFLLESIKFRDVNFLFVKISIGIVAFAFLYRLFKRKFDLKNILLALSGVGLALLHIRSFPYLVFLSLPATLILLGEIRKNIITSFLFLVVCILLLLEAFLYLNGDYYKFTDNQHQARLDFVESSKGALDFTLSHNLPNPIFNNFDIGSYILYRGYPKYQVFVDGRPEAYPAQFFTGIYIPAQSDYKNFKEAEEIYGFKTIIFSHTDQTPWGRTFLSAVIKDTSWKLVYIDDFMLVLVKDEVAGERNIQSIDLSKLTPALYSFDNHVSYLRVSLFLLSTGNTESSRQFIQKSLQLFPDDPIANSLIGQPAKNIFFW